MNQFLTLLHDENGQISMMRVLAFILVVSYVVKDMGHTFSPSTIAAPDIQDLFKLIAGLGFKIIQKPFEKKKNGTG